MSALNYKNAIIKCRHYDYHAIATNTYIIGSANTIASIIVILKIN